MKRVYLTTLLSALLVIIIAFVFNMFFTEDEVEKNIKVGFVYVGDDSTSYTGNFIKAQFAIENKYGDNVETLAKYNVAEGNEESAIVDLIENGCELIFTTSYGYGVKTKELAQKYPDVQFCQATCSNANEEPKLDNYHTFMGEIYQGRYVAGVIAGMKLKELIDSGKLTSEQAKLGYVGAYPYAEVISGYTAFFFGVQSVVSEVTMTVKYTNTWSSYALEKKCAEELIQEGCVIISQHSDTAGPAVACEETESDHIVYHVGYNQSMADIAPTTYLTGSTINWKPYIMAAVEAVLKDKKIESVVEGNQNGNDIGAGFEEGWIQMLELNELSAAANTQEKADDIIEQLIKGEIQVFKGDFIGVNVNDESDTLDLNEGYIENETSSAPTFDYVLKDVITIMK